MVFRGFSLSELAITRTIIEMVLSTDPTKHNQLMDDLKALVQEGPSQITDAKQKQVRNR